MRFTLHVEIVPSGAFGVSTSETPVLRSGPAEPTGLSNRLADMAQVGYGKASEDRSPQDALRESISLVSVIVDLEDNLASIHIEAPDMYQAHEIAIREFDRFVGHLSLNHRQYFSYRPLSMESEEAETTALPQAFPLKVFRYDLDRLRKHLGEAEQYHPLDDGRLNRALQYFQLALFQIEERSRIQPIAATYDRIGVREWYLSSAYLNLWKALASVVGDPSRDSNHQSRYKQLGISYEFYRNRIQKMHKARNGLDVAHASLDEGKIQELESEFEEALDTVVLVVDSYRQFLASQPKPC
jgi:hypothetical protein